MFTLGLQKSWCQSQKGLMCREKVSIILHSFEGLVGEKISKSDFHVQQKETEKEEKRETVFKLFENLIDQNGEVIHF
jgi:hypothetical protein